MKNLLRIELDINRIYGFDILRALAILFVLIHHTQTLIPKEKFEYIKPFLYDGVGIFFVLSGFLIGGILLKIMNNGKFTCTKLISFWKRRWLRTLPNYFLVLIILISLNLFFTERFDLVNVIPFLFFSQNLFYKHPSFFPEAWSLSVEEWFYLLVPSVLFILGLFSKSSLKKNLISTLATIIITITLYRYFKFVNLESSGDYGLLFDRQVFTRLDRLMFGFLGSYVHFYNNSFWHKFRNLSLVLGLLLLLIFKVVEISGINTLYNSVFSFSITSITTLLFLPYLSNVKKGKGIIFKILTYISLTSYSIYLINFSIVKFWILNNIDFSFLSDINTYLSLITKLIVYWSLTFILSILLYKNFEIPTTNLRDKNLSIFKFREWKTEKYQMLMAYFYR